MVWTKRSYSSVSYRRAAEDCQVNTGCCNETASSYEQAGDAGYLPAEIGNGNFRVMRSKRESRVSMREGDRILINKGISKKVFIVARADVPHSSERVFVSKSGGKYTIGLKVWRTDYAWSEKNQMWVPKH